MKISIFFNQIHACESKYSLFYVLPTSVQNDYYCFVFTGMSFSNFQHHFLSCTSFGYHNLQHFSLFRKQKSILFRQLLQPASETGLLEATEQHKPRSLGLVCFCVM